MKSKIKNIMKVLKIRLFQNYHKIVIQILFLSIYCRGEMWCDKALIIIILNEKCLVINF